MSAPDGAFTRAGAVSAKRNDAIRAALVFLRKRDYPYRVADAAGLLAASVEAQARLAGAK